MLTRVRTWLQARHRKDAAVRRALVQFQSLRGTVPMSGHVLRVGTHETIVRIMYLTNHVPPERAWFAVPNDGSEVRELSFEDVREFESSWR